MYCRVLAFILLLLHVNFTMFIAQVDEQDVYDNQGRLQNDINTLAEYIQDILLNRPSKLRQDEDDDNARYSLSLFMPLYDFQQLKIKTTREDFPGEGRQEYSLFRKNDCCAPIIEISTPPPRCA